MKQKIIIVSEAHRNRAIDVIRSLPLEPAHVVEVRERTRSLEQNARLWAILTDIAEQVDWYGNKLTKEEWKDVFSASLKQQKVVPGIEGGFVVVGAHTSKMSVAEMSELIEFATAFGCQRQVRWSDPQYL